MTIGELARAAGVPISTLRFYERRGLLLPADRTAGGYRRYRPDDAARVRFLRRAQALGFSLAECAALLQFSRATTVRRADLSTVGTRKLAELDERISDLKRVRQALVGLMKQPCLDLAAPCPIIGALGDDRSTTARASRASGGGRR
jgi:MerR family mercuric resistance operon transcriptional regulator